MATRSDVDTDFIPSPRIATVQAPSVEITVQDTVDTLRTSEESFRGMSETKLIDAAGKEDLGGGVQVGITTTLQDTQIAFEGRTAPAETGTVTTSSTAPVNRLIDLNDINATFQSAGVVRGSLVINFDDQSIAEVYDVDSEIHLRTRIPVNGITNDFTLGDNYQVFNVIQCEISGGNVVAVDETDTTISPVLPTAFTQVVRTASSSATLINASVGAGIPTAEENANAVWAADVTASAPPPNSSARHLVEGGMQNGAIWLDGIDGSDAQEGTVSLPIKTFTQARLVLIDYQMKRIRVVAMVDTQLQVGLDDYEIIADNNLGDAVLDLNNQSVSNTHFTGISITGSILLGSPISPGINCTNSTLYSPMTNLGGTFNSCGFVCQTGETFQLQAIQSRFIECYAGSVETGNIGSPVTNLVPPRFDVSGANVDAIFRNWSGSLEIIGLNDATSRVEIEASSGVVTLDATNTAGTIIIRGDCELVNNIVGSPVATVIDQRTTLLVAENAGYEDGAVWLSAFTGNDANNGTVTNPVQTSSRAREIALSKDLQRINIVSNGFYTLTEDFSGFTFTNSLVGSKIVNFNGQLLNSAVFKDLTLTGTVGGVGPNISASRCLFFNNTSNLAGNFYECTFIMSAGNSFQLAGIQSTFLDCVSGTTEFDPTFAVPKFDVSGPNVTAAFRRWSGPMEVDGMNNASSSLEIDCSSGKVTILSTCTAGTILIRGNCEIVNNATGSPTVTVIDDTTSALVWRELAGTAIAGSYGEIVETIIKYNQNRTLINETAFTLTVFDDDGSTPLKVFDLKDENGVASITSIFERLPQ